MHMIHIHICRQNTYKFKINLKYLRKKERKEGGEEGKKEKKEEGKKRKRKVKVSQVQ